MNHQLEADGIEFSIGPRRILNHIYVSAQTNKITGILGQNGQGKTSLFNVIYGNVKAQSRSVRFDGQSIFEAFKRPDLLTYLPQFNFVPSQLSLTRVFKDFELDIADFIDFLPEFDGRSKHQIGQLSGGQRRLVEVYLIIKSRSQFSLLDEPFSHVMPLHIEKIQALITTEKTKKGFIITDHFFREVIAISNSVYVLKDGATHLTQSIEDLKTLGYANF